MHLIQPFKRPASPKGQRDEIEAAILRVSFLQRLVTMRILWAFLVVGSPYDRGAIGDSLHLEWDSERCLVSRRWIAVTIG